MSYTHGTNCELCEAPRCCCGHPHFVKCGLCLNPACCWLWSSAYISFGFCCRADLVHALSKSIDAVTMWLLYMLWAVCSAYMGRSLPLLHTAELLLSFRFSAGQAAALSSSVLWSPAKHFCSARKLWLP